MNFRVLQARLVSLVRARVRNGELSERGLARLTGISQPHIHNVLKGTRLLSTDMADQMLRRLRIDVADLLTAEDGAAPAQDPADGCTCRAVTLLDGWIGREHPYPKEAGRGQYPFPAADVERLESPVAARLASDPLRAPILSGRGVVLLDCSEAACKDPAEEGYFALDLHGGGTIGSVRRARRHLYLWNSKTEAWQSIPLRGRGPRDVVRGRVGLVVWEL